MSRAKEVVFTVLSKGHRVPPIMHTRYKRLLWVARLARRPGVTHVFAQAIWESGGRPPGTGPVGRALHAAASLGWTPREGWCCWDVPGQEHPIHFVQQPLRQLQHRVRDSLCCHSWRQLEARRPVTFGGLGDGADGPACRAALRAGSMKLEKSLLRGLLAGAVWTAARVSGSGMRASSACPDCGAAHEDEPTFCGTAQSGGTPGERGSPGSTTRQGPSPTWARRTAGPPACEKRAFSPSGWHGRWTRTSSTSSCTACMACTWRSSRPAWRPERGISRATATPSSRSSRARGPATPTHGTPSLAPYRGTASATSRGCSRGCRQTGGGPKTSSTTWSGGLGR